MKTKNLQVKQLGKSKNFFFNYGSYLLCLFYRKQFFYLLPALILLVNNYADCQITLLKDYQNNYSAPIGTFQGINFREAGFSGLCPVANTNGKEFWTVSDRGVNIDAANANLPECRPTYDKIYAFPTYAPKIHRIRVNGDSIQILQTITLKRPDGSNASGLLNPASFGSTEAEVISTDTVLNCANFNAKTAAKDIWGIDSEGILIDKDGNFWICEEGGPAIWKVNPNGVVLKRFTPYANQPGAQAEDVLIDTVFKYRKNNRGFESIAIAPNGKIYAIVQSPLLYPDKATGEGTRIHRILEINPADNSIKMFAYLNEGIIGDAGPDQIRLRDWKISDMAAVNDTTFLVIEAALRGTTDIKRIYSININTATPVTSGLYNEFTLEGLIDSSGLAANSITPVSKTLFVDLLANGWPSALDKAEGLAIINDSTIAVGNDNDYGQVSPTENGIATATDTKSHVIVYGLQGSNKIQNYKPLDLMQGQQGITSSKSPYILPAAPGVNVTSILTVNDSVGGYPMVGLPDGLGAFDNGDSTFTLLMNHELSNTAGIPRAHDSAGAFVSKWIINKSNLRVMNGADLMQKVYLWDTVTNSFVQRSTAFSRFCSADLPPVSAFYNSTSALGTQERIFMNGEENGMEGRAVGHIVTGANAGTSYQLPYLGRFAWENSVASPTVSNKTVVAGMDDGPGGQVYFYVGTKTNTGTEIDKAGLNNGKLFGISVTGLAKEDTLGVPAAGARFSLVDLGSVQNTTGKALDSISIAAGVTTFLRPEDGAWDPSSPQDFYFNTTDAFTLPSRLWRLRFDNPTSPETGGTIEAVLDGTEGQKMLDNMAIDKYGHILLQEDVGNNAHLGKIWQYAIATDELAEIAVHDSTRFLEGGTNFLTQDEESSGIIDAESILGPGIFLLVNQSHYKDSIHPGIVEGSQLLALRNPDSYGSALPLNLLSFTGRLTEGKTELSWNTANEVDTKHFEIERSGDGYSFTKIANVEAVGRGDNHYNTIDAKPQHGNNYYRLKMMDKDGKFIYSSVVLIRVAESKPFDFVMYPNPAINELRIISATDNTALKINIYNQQGQKLTSKSVPAAGVISIKHLLKGVYLVQVISGQGVKVKKLIKE